MVAPMSILVVAPYPPMRDGIGAYALQQVARLRAQGDRVEVLSPLPSAAHHHLELVGWRGPLALGKRIRRYDRVIVHFYLDLFYPQPLDRRLKAAITVELIAAFRLARHLTVLVHEIDYSWGRRQPMRRLARAMLTSADRLEVHTASEQDALARAFGIPPSSITITEHGANFVRRSSLTKEEARKELGIPADCFVFLCIGFIQPHKGFDRAIRAFGRLGDAGCRLYVVGSLRVAEPEYVAHLEELCRLGEATAGVEVRSEYLSDGRFDDWIVAADAVVLPYRLIWSSSVLERARLYERPVIAADMGGLRDQADDGVTLVSDDVELRAAMHRAVGHQLQESDPTDPFVLPEAVSADAVMRTVRRRAASRRPQQRPGQGSPHPPPSAAAPLLRVAPLGPPVIASRSRVRLAIKRALHRVTWWQVAPVVDQANALRSAMLEVAEQLAAPAPSDGAPGSRD